MRLRTEIGWLLVLVGLGVALGGCTEKYVKWTHQGDVLLEVDDWDAARVRYQKAVSKFPKYAPALLQIGNISLWEEEYAEAEEFFSRTIEVDPLMTDAYVGRGEARLSQGNLEGAYVDFKKAKEQGEESANAGIGIIAYIKGDYDRAFGALAQAVQDEDDVFRAAVYTFKTALASGDLRSGLDILNKAVDPPVEELLEDEEYEPYWQLEDQGLTVIKRLRAELSYALGDYSAASTALSGIDDGLFLGMWVREPSDVMKRQLGSVVGVVVEYVHLGSPAANAGVQASDVITSFERTPIRSAEDFWTALGTYEARMTHGVALVELVRENQVLALRMTPGDFSTRDLIREAASGATRLPLIMAPDEQLTWP